MFAKGMVLKISIMGEVAFAILSHPHTYISKNTVNDLVIYVSAAVNHD